MTDFLSAAPELQLDSASRAPIPEPLLPKGENPPVMVLLSTGPDAEWAAQAAIRIASGWAATGRRVVLADLHLEEPRLHEYLGEPNLDGVVDAFLYGASLARTARPAAGHGFYLIPAGTYTADVEALYRHPRWPKIVAGFAEANASLIIFAPRSAGVLAQRFGNAAEVILLGGPAELPANHSPVRAVVLPPDPDPSLTLEFPIPASTPLDIRVTRISPDPAVEDETEMPEFGDPIPETRRHRGARPLLWIALGAVVLGLLAIWLLARRPELLAPVQRAASAADSATNRRAAAVPQRTPDVRPLGIPLTYSVQVTAFNSLDAARAEVRTARNRVPEIPFFVSPERIDGIVYHRVLAGMYADSTDAGALRDRLVAERLINREDVAGSAWSLLRNAPLAFQLGEMPTRETAERLADSLDARGVPGYVVRIPQSDGSERFRIYGGAFRDTASAEAMGGLLEAAQIQAPLAPRFGPAPPPAAEAAPGP